MRKQARKGFLNSKRELRTEVPMKSFKVKQVKTCYSVLHLKDLTRIDKFLWCYMGWWMTEIDTFLYVNF